jgi:DNA-directed RNA polymerase subunit RPC12/RpoP
MTAYRKPKPRCPVSGKKPYPDELVVASMAEIISQKKKIELRYYRCPYCEKWHLTKRKPAKVR